MQPYANRRTIPFWQAVGVFALFTLGCLWWTRTPWALGALLFGAYWACSIIVIDYPQEIEHQEGNLWLRGLREF